MPSDPTTSVSTSFQLVLPPDPQLLRVVRLVASGLASLAQLDLDAVEEIRVSADELVSTLIGAGAGGDITLAFELTEERVRLTGETALPSGAELQVDPISDRILATVASRHTWSSEGGRAVGSVERDLAGH